jgi:hypothetical protein
MVMCKSNPRIPEGARGKRVIIRGHGGAIRRASQKQMCSCGGSVSNIPIIWPGAWDRILLYATPPHKQISLARPDCLDFPRLFG